MHEEEDKGYARHDKGVGGIDEEEHGGAWWNDNSVIYHRVKTPLLSHLDGD